MRRPPRHWPSILSVFFFLPAIWKGIKVVIGIGGDVDFVVSKVAHPGWVGKMVGMLLNPPAWALVPLILAGLLLIWWDVHRPQARPCENGNNGHPTMSGQGGAGGSAQVGGSGTAIGGKGGDVFGSAVEIVGGQGGGGFVAGDGTYLGGDGGSVTDGTVLPPPARNGRFRQLRNSGIIVPAWLAEAGRGGAVNGYYELYNLALTALKDRWEVIDHESIELSFLNPSAVLIDDINGILEEKNLIWRARLRDHQIEFFAETRVGH